MHDVEVTVLEKLFQEGRIYRQLVEKQWVKKLVIRVPQGCNVKLNIKISVIE